MIATRIFFFLIALLCATAMGVAVFYFQQQLGLAPCPLCVFQRVVVIAIGVVCLIAALHGPKGIWARLYASVACAIALIGVAIAGRHVWLQNLPKDQVPECGPGLEFLMEAFPLAKVLEVVFSGSGECAEIAWQFLTLSIPEWTLIFFVGIAISLVIFVLEQRKFFSE